MSFDKNYPNRKDHRKPYHGSARFSGSCRPGGSCPVCSGDRQYQERLVQERAKDELQADGVDLDEILSSAL